MLATVSRRAPQLRLCEGCRSTPSGANRRPAVFVWPSMRFAVAALLLLHGLIHLMGFSKAFGLARFDDLRMPISRPAGLLWLLACLLMLTAAGMFLFRYEAWYWTGAAALLLSQAMIVRSWSDAKFGTVANLLILVPVLVAFGQNREGGFRRVYERAVQRAEATALGQKAPLTEADLIPLPPLVQQYLRVTGAVGKPKISQYRLEFAGSMRQKPDGAWLEIRVRQHSFVKPPLRAFYLQSRLFGVPFDGLHLFEGPHATMQIQVAGLVPVVDARGPEMDQGETVTLLNDMCLLAPATLIDPAIQWTPVSDRAVAARFTHEGQTIDAVLSFDEQGLLRDFSSEDRFLSADGKQYARHRWTTPISAYSEFGGRRVVSRAEAVWHLPEGPFPYARFELRAYEAR